jgi:tyrosine-protein kinase Etk/Wzc
MSDANLNQNNNQQEDEISLLDLLIVLVENKGLIVKSTLLVGAAALVFALMATPIYESEATILPPQQQSGASAMLAQLGGLGALAGSSGAIKNPNDIYIGMMQSRTVHEQLNLQFDLQKYYGVETVGRALTALEKSTQISSGKDGLISIKVSDKNPAQAAKLANAYVVELKKLSAKLAIGEAANRRAFFEKQFTKTKQQLAEAEIGLKQMQERTGLLELNGSSMATMEALVELRAQVAAKQVELSAMSEFLTADNPRYKQVQAELSGLQAQILAINKGLSDDDVLISKDKVPAAGLEYVRKLRNVKYQETLFELMAKQVEMARLDEAKDGANIQVLDAAIPAENKSEPKRALIVLLGLMAGGFIGVLLALIRKAIQISANNKENVERIVALKQAWKGNKA